MKRDTSANYFTHYKIKIFITNIFFLLFFSSCSGLEKSEQEKMRRHNAMGEFIYRKKTENFFSIQWPKQRENCSYPWEKTQSNSQKRFDSILK
jgi:hypothetical protein